MTIHVTNMFRIGVDAVRITQSELHQHHEKWSKRWNFGFWGAESHKKSLLREFWSKNKSTWVRKITIVLKMTIHVTNICLELVLVQLGLRNPNCISTMKKRVFWGCSDSIIWKNQVADYKIWIGEKLIFFTLGWEKLKFGLYNLNDILGKNRARENHIGWEK